MPFREVWSDRKGVCFQMKKFRYCWKEGIEYNTELVWDGKKWSGDMGKLPPIELCEACHTSQSHNNPKTEICGKCLVCKNGMGFVFR